MSTFVFGKLTYVKKKKGTKIIRGIPQIYKVNKSLKTTNSHKIENQNLAGLAKDNNKTNQTLVYESTLFTFQALWILMFSSVAGMFLSNRACRE
jgi:hypothetical protein